MTYRLVSVVSHFGNSITNGHYIMSYRHQNDAGGYIFKVFDDAKVKESQTETIENASAYLVFYQRISTADAINLNHLDSIDLANAFRNQATSDRQTPRKTIAKKFKKRVLNSKSKRKLKTNESLSTVSRALSLFIRDGEFSNQIDSIVSRVSKITFLAALHVHHTFYNAVINMGPEDANNFIDKYVTKADGLYLYYFFCQVKIQLRKTKFEQNDFSRLMQKHKIKRVEAEGLTQCIKLMPRKYTTNFFNSIIANAKSIVHTVLKIYFEMEGIDRND